MKIAVLTLGCKTNQAESSSIESSALSSGHSIVSLGDSPDICIVNTCTVTAKSDSQSRQLIRRALRSGAEVVVTGCYAELRGEELRGIAEGLRVVRNSEKSHIINILSDENETMPLSISRPSRARSRPFVKIQDGCDYSCSYCTIPMARGPSRSRPVEEVLWEVRELEGMGFAEVVLTGIHIGLYGYDLKPEVSLSELVTILLEKTSSIRVRVSSLEVDEIDDRLIDLLSDGRLCPHLHVPLQSGDDGILEMMKRPYTTRGYRAKVDKVLDRVPNLALGTDVIVGFPGEGEREFEATVRLLQEVPFSYLHIFPYSDRPGTPSSTMGGRVAPEVKRSRSERLKSLDEEKRSLYRRRQIGRVLNVVCEGEFTKALHTGKSENYLSIYFENSPCEPGAVVCVKIGELFRDGLYGLPVKSI